MRRLSSGTNEVAVKRVDGWLVTAPSTGASRVVADLEVTIGSVYDATSVAALAAADAVAASARRDFAARDRQRAKLAEIKHAKDVAALVLRSREQAEAAALITECGVSREVFDKITRFATTPREVEVMGSRAASTFNGKAVSTRALVLRTIPRLQNCVSFWGDIKPRSTEREFGDLKKDPRF